MAQFMYYPATKLFYNIPTNIDNLYHDKQEFVRHRFRSACYAQSYFVQEPAFINPWPTNVVCMCVCIYIYIYIERERERAPCKARNVNVVYIWTYVWQR
jgi:hypothetical protein